jgi:hypothetical protein
VGSLYNYGYSVAYIVKIGLVIAEIFDDGKMRVCGILNVTW